VGLDEFLTLNEHAAGAAAGVENPAFIRLQHFDEDIYHTPRGIELAALFTFGKGELAQEVFVNPAQRIFAFSFVRPKLNGAN